MLASPYHKQFSTVKFLPLKSVTKPFSSSTGTEFLPYKPSKWKNSSTLSEKQQKLHSYNFCYLGAGPQGEGPLRSFLFEIVCLFIFSRFVTYTAMSCSLRILLVLKTSLFKRFIALSQFSKYHQDRNVW